MIKSTTALRHKGGTNVYDGYKETREDPHFDKKHHNRGAENHRKGRKNVLTDQGKEADDKSIKEYPRIQREKSERLSSRRREKTDEKHRRERLNHAESAEDSRKRSQLRPHDKLQQSPHRNAEKRSVKSQVFKL